MRRRRIDIGGNQMNILQYISPKSDVTYIGDRMCIPTAMQTMRLSGYSAVPVVGDDGIYKGVVREGDFLWAIEDGRDKDKQGRSLKVASLLSPERNPAVSVTAQMDDVIRMALDQNFVPVVDDRGMFIGIVTRKSVIEHLMKR